MSASIVWLMLWSGVLIAGLTGIVVSANNIRFHHRVNAEVRQLLGSGADGVAINGKALERLPIPVQRYLRQAIGDRHHSVRSARLHQTGTFRPDLNGQWFPLTGVQYFTGDPPGFIWWGRVRLAPGIWIEARDRSTAGVGNMLVVVESTLTLTDARGAELDQGALLRLLGELAWLPTAYIDERYVRWTAIDDRHAQATIAVNGRLANGLFEFNDDLPTRFSAERFRDVGGGRSVLTPFLGELRDYRRVDGLLIPHEMIASWIIDGTPTPYARFRVTAIEFDAAVPS